MRTVFQRWWEIRTPIITRYMDQKYVDEFLSEGKLRIPSFLQFRANPDEQRGDVLEGRVSARISVPNGSHTVVAINGQEAYVLCAATVENPSMKANFNTSAGFRILNPIAFADTVSRHIPGFVGGMEGLCFYRSDVAILKTDQREIVPPDKFQDPEQWARDYEKALGELTKEAFFVKRLIYAHQGEYRFIWFATGNEKPFIDIFCPEAVQFCEAMPK